MKKGVYNSFPSFTPFTMLQRKGCIHNYIRKIENASKHFKTWEVQVLTLSHWQAPMASEKARVVIKIGNLFLVATFPKRVAKKSICTPLSHSSERRTERWSMENDSLVEGGLVHGRWQKYLSAIRCKWPLSSSQSVESIQALLEAIVSDMALQKSTTSKGYLEFVVVPGKPPKIDLYPWVFAFSIIFHNPVMWETNGISPSAPRVSSYITGSWEENRVEICGSLCHLVLPCFGSGNCRSDWMDISPGSWSLHFWGIPMLLSSGRSFWWQNLVGKLQ